jgi:hypothetical protein
MKYYTIHKSLEFSKQVKRYLLIKIPLYYENYYFFSVLHVNMFLYSLSLWWFSKWIFNRYRIHVIKFNTDKTVATLPLSSPYHTYREWAFVEILYHLQKILEF